MMYAIRITGEDEFLYMGMDDEGDAFFTKSLYRAWLGDMDRMEDMVDRMREDGEYPPGIVDIIGVEMSVTSAVEQEMNPQYTGQYVLQDPIGGGFYTGDVTGIWEFEIAPRQDNIHRATKFPTIDVANKAIAEMVDLQSRPGSDFRTYSGQFAASNYEVIAL